MMKDINRVDTADMTKSTHERVKFDKTIFECCSCHAAGDGGVRRGGGRRRGRVPPDARGDGLVLGPLRRRRALVQAAAAQPGAAAEAARPFHPRRRRAQLRPDQLRPEL
jgi:hypothetical protein